MPPTRADREYRIHLEHVGLTSRVVEVARSLYKVGQGTQQDLLRSQAELSRLHVDVAGIEQQRRSARAMLNALMDRAPDAPLGPARELVAGELLGAAEQTPRDADERMDDRRPELKAAARAVKRSDALLEGAKREANLPALMVGADYWYMPMAPSHHAYGAMVSMTLPWLNSRHRDEVRAAERTGAAERSALPAQRGAARYQLHDADARLRAARETLALVHERVLPDTRRSFEAAQAMFGSGQGDITPVLDASRSYLQVRIDEVRVRGRPGVEPRRLRARRRPPGGRHRRARHGRRRWWPMSGATADGEPERNHPHEDRVPMGVRTMSFVRWGLGAVAALSIAYATGALARFQAAETRASHVTLYHCPMHPSVIRDHPGECPICGMTLVPSVAGDAPASGATQPRAAGATSVPGLSALELPPERIQLVGMRTAKVERAVLGDALHAVGVVAPSERGLAEILVRFSGWVQRLMAAETGQKVRRGEVLATVYSPEVLRAEQEYLTARGWEGRVAGADEPASADHHAAPMTGLAPPASLAADARRRLELLGVAAPEIDAIAARGKVADSVPIRSPVDGYVTARNVVPGAAIEAGAPLLEVADLSRVWVVAQVFEQDAARLRVGQKATLDLTAYPGELFAGRVQFISPTLDPTTRTLRVRLEFANRAGPGGVKLRPGMYGNVALALPAASGLVIPTEALVDTGEHQYVFVAKDQGRFEPRAVRVSGRTGDKARIADGLVQGETVVTTGNFLLDSESRLRAAIEGHAATATTGK